MEDNEKMHNAIKEVSKRDCIIMGDFNHTVDISTEYRERGSRVFKFSTNYFPFSTCVRSNQGREGVRHSIELTEGIV